MHIQPFFDQDTATFSYVLSDEASRQCAIIDSVHDYDSSSAKVSTFSADKIIDYVNRNHLSVEWILETHIHADHLTASNYLKQKLGGKIAISETISKVLDYWVPLFNTYHDTPLDGSQFDHLFKDGESFKIGELEARVMHTPGHTPACASYVVKDAVFVGDTLFMPYGGTARADFPGGDAKTLYRSIQKIFSLGDDVRLFICHDYPPEGKEPSCEVTVAEQKKNNKYVNDRISEDAYIQLRNERDKNLPVPRLLLPSIQVNLRAGYLGDAEENGIQYIKIPLNQL